MCAKKVILKKEPNLNVIEVDYIHRTMDYDKYEKLQANRPIDSANKEKIKESFRTFGNVTATISIMLTYSVDGTPRYVIANGHHTIPVAKELGLPLNVFILQMVEDTKLNIVRYVTAINDFKGWSTINYLKAFSSLEIEEYLMFEDLMTRYDLTITDLLSLYTGGSTPKEMKMFKSGLMKFKDKEDSDEMLDSLLMIQKVIPNKSFCRRSFYKVLQRVPNYSIFSTFILKESRRITFVENEKSFYSQLLDCLNRMTK